MARPDPIIIKQDLPKELQQVREQLHQHYEQQIKGLLEELLQQRELLESGYQQRKDRDLALHQQKLDELSE